MINLRVDTAAFVAGQTSAATSCRHLLSSQVADRLRTLRSWETLLDDDPMLWALNVCGGDPVALLQTALSSEFVLGQCRDWLAAHGWH